MTQPAAFNELANTPLEITIRGKAYKVRRISMDTVFGKCEAAVISQQIKRIHEMAATLRGDEKTDFLAKAMLESIPSGDKLDAMAVSFMRSHDGVRMVLLEALRQDQPNVEQELDLARLVMDNDPVVLSMTEFLVGRRPQPKKEADGQTSAAPLAVP